MTYSEIESLLLPRYKTMQEYSTIPHKKTCLAIFLVTCFLLTVLYYDDAVSRYRDVFPTPENADFIGTSIFDNLSGTKQDFTKSQTQSADFYTVTEQYTNKGINFLVSSSKCKMIDIDPVENDAKKYFRPEKYKSCRKLDLLTYVTKTDNIATLHIDNDMAPSYSQAGVSCCYSNVTRKKLSDDDVIVSSCRVFNDAITLHHDPVIVKCTDLTDKKTHVYENVHVAVTPTEVVQKKMSTFDNSTKPLSVLFIGIDSISRLNLIRSLPKTYAFLEQNGWISLKGYNKIEDNTFPNVMAILTGFNNTVAYKVCNPKVVGKLDNCSILWYDYRNFGYITAYGEDETSINTFNYLKKGFRQPPTDYYFRPYVQATEKLKTSAKDGMTYCTGPETAGERIFNLAKDFATTFKNYPSFGFFWMNSFSHNKVNTPSGMDNKVKNFLEDLTSSGVTENSIIIFLSDHGIRFGDIRQTDTGWLEERLPYIYTSFPQWFQEKFSKEYNNFRNNTNKLTCPYDVHMTLKHILVLSGLNYSITPSDACPQCKSLFEEVDLERSCEDAAIPPHWCTCAGYRTIHLEKDLESNVTNFLLQELESIIHDNGGDKLCAKYSVSHVEKIRISQHLPYKNETYLLIKVKTNPEAVFETTISFSGDISSRNFSLSGDISRLDSYGKTSKCVRDAYLKKYCYCLD